MTLYEFVADSLTDASEFYKADAGEHCSDIAARIPQPLSTFHCSAMIGSVFF
jgi:hypothetical protein